MINPTISTTYILYTYLSYANVSVKKKGLQSQFKKLLNLLMSHNCSDSYHRIVFFNKHYFALAIIKYSIVIDNVCLYIHMHSKLNCRIFLLTTCFKRSKFLIWISWWNVCSLEIYFVNNKINVFIINYKETGLSVYLYNFISFCSYNWQQ